MDNIFENDLFEVFANASENVYIYVCDMATDESRWSRNTIEYFDLDSEYMTHAGDLWLERIHPEDRQIYKNDIDSIFSGLSTCHNCQYRALNRYGDYVWLECYGSVKNDSDGKPKYFAGMMTRLDNQNKYDPLTKLLTRHELESSTCYSGPGYALLIGLDDFRKVVNNYGYNYGNTLLADFAEMLTATVSKFSKVFRFGGDEFLILTPKSSKPDIQNLFNQIKKNTAAYKGSTNHFINIKFSGGAVPYAGTGTNIEKHELISNLEHSLEHAKAESKGNLVFFSVQLAYMHRRTLRVREALTQSIANNFEGFALYFQPILNNKTRRITASEALLRWHSKELGGVSPVEFIKLLEASGEIQAVGLWVMDTALRYASIWQKKYPGFTVGFNVSYIQLRDHTFCDELIKKSYEYDLDPSLIVVELTESCNIEDTENLAIQFKRLQAHGFKIALDDFGIGYSSLALIKDLPVNSIKIDHSFVRGLCDDTNPAEMAVIESILVICRRLSVNCVAEGIENEEIEQILNEFGIDYLQGYLYSKPIPIAEFQDMLSLDYGTA